MNSLERASQLTGINPSVRVARLEPPDSEWRGTSIGSLHSASHPFGFAQGRSAFDREDRGMDRRDRRHRRDRAWSESKKPLPKFENGGGGECIGRTPWLGMAKDKVSGSLHSASHLLRFAQGRSAFGPNDKG